MAEDHNALWEKSLRKIRRAVSEEQFSNYFEPLTFKSYSERSHELLVQVPSQYIYEYLEQHFVDVMRHALFSVFGQGVVLRYQLVVTKEKNQRVTVEGVRTAEPIEAPRRGKGNSLDAQLMQGKTFQTFIEGTANKLARSVGIRVAEHPGKQNFNPFFIYGPSGCGKTHLINAIGCHARELYPQKRILYVPARIFQVQFTEAVKKNTTNDFITFYQSIDLLIVDDIQEWASAPRTLDTFFHIFDHLLRTEHQIVLAADRPPVELEGVKDRLLTRFKVGMTAEMEQPNEQLCVDILRAKCHRDGLKIPQDVISYIARTANGSVRDLEGVLNSLMAFSIAYNNCVVDMRLAERVVRQAVRTDERPVSVDHIVSVVCRHLGVTERDVNGTSRRQQTVMARQTAMYLALKLTSMTSSRVGQLIGRRDHSTVLHSCTAVEKRMKQDPDYALQVKDIELDLAKHS